MFVLTCGLQAEVLSDLLVVTWMSEVKDAVTSQVHLETKGQRCERAEVCCKHAAEADVTAACWRRVGGVFGMDTRRSTRF